MVNSAAKLAFFMSLCAFLGIFATVGGPINWLHSILLFCVIGVSLAQIVISDRFNLGVSFSFFSLFFFGAIPLLEHRLNITYHGAHVPQDYSYLTASSLALLSCIFFYLGYGLRKKTPSSDKTLPKPDHDSLPQRRRVYFTGVTCLILLATLIGDYYHFDLNNMFFRGFGENVESTAMGYSFITFFIRPLFFNLVLLFILVRISRTSLNDVGIYFLCILLLVFVSPMGIPRTLTGALYIPLLVLAFFPRYASKYFVLCVITYAILFVAPVADVFRLIQFRDEISLIQNFSLNYFFAGHFDAFHNLTQVIETNYVSQGRQILGALLFWVPRAFWPTKPVGTSFDFAEFAGFRSSNISFPLTAELYVDFGMLGVILGMFLLGVVFKWLDNFLTKPRSSDSLTPYLFAMAHLELSILSIYLLRGNFLSGFAFTMGVALTLLVIVLSIRVLRKISLRLIFKLRLE
jgi:oligosaccharide repeat unit polymerase